MKIIEFKINEKDISVYEVIFKGQLRAGKEIQSYEFTNMLKEVLKESQSKVIIFNVEEVSFWDSEGMRKILILVREINEKYVNRAAVVGAVDSKLLLSAKEKYEINGSEIPWKSTKEEFLKSL